MQLSAWIMRGDLAQFLWNISYGAALKVMTFFMTMKETSWDKQKVLHYCQQSRTKRNNSILQTPSFLFQS